ncbi:zinc ribbon domain-containing protein [Paraburkholderia sp.]|uniref:zinc ribbon domain-containing protein n=1 Tax=Paraburkholderia sp. TaxID=1926495 RepID=UPI002399A87E|nr:zinc ribbon domain-containing protein [Paraburkholderia sp.]MDE1179466.1 zinc ribbon domain-containing protein [Paraburkholderia sp.]
MALIKCRECGTEVSSKAPACVKCGAPVKKQMSKGAETAAGLVVFGLIGWILVEIFGGGSGHTGAAEKPTQTEAACNADDLQCLGDKGVVAAGVYCKDDVERLATHSVKWTDGTFETKFSRFRWADKNAGTITYIGDKAEFQNGFGAYSPVTYECDLARDNKTVLDARVHEGRLPK